MEYLEELFPQPVMIGLSPLARARTRELERFIDTAIAARINSIFFNTSQIFQDRPHQTTGLFSPLEIL